MAEEFVLSIDQGTRGSTVLMFEHEGTVTGRAYSRADDREAVGGLSYCWR